MNILQYLKWSGYKSIMKVFESTHNKKKIKKIMKKLEKLTRYILKKNNLIFAKHLKDLIS